MAIDEINRATPLPPTMPTKSAVPTGTPLTTGVAAGAAVSATPAATVTPPAPVREPQPPAQAQVQAQAVPTRNPIAVPVYEIRDPAPPAPEPKARRRQVYAPLPLGRVRPVDALVLKREWLRRRERRPGGEEMAERPPLWEQAIQQMISRTNDDLLARGLPFRLVLARDAEGGYCLDIYDCSEESLCRLSQEVALDLNQLLTILDNIEHETGMIINIKT